MAVDEQTCIPVPTAWAIEVLRVTGLHAIESNIIGGRVSTIRMLPCKAEESC